MRHQASAGEGASEGEGSNRTTHAGALACIELAWDAQQDVDAGFTVLGVKGVPVHGVQVRRIVDHASGRVLDEALIVRWSRGGATICLHGGRVIVEEVLAWLERRGAHVTDARDVPLAARFASGGVERDERSTQIRQRVWEGMSVCQSPRGIELLARQPAAWEASDRDLREPMDAHDERLNRLITPPLVAAVGASNIGKSSLLNAVARRDVALVHDSIGTTRDYVGATAEIDGLLVRWVDTPGYIDHTVATRHAEGSLDQRAYEAAMAVASQADVVLACGDHAHPPRLGMKVRDGATVIRLRLRSDLAPGGAADGAVFDAACSVRDAGSIERLCQEIRRRLVRDDDLASQRAWRWWR